MSRKQILIVAVLVLVLVPAGWLYIVRFEGRPPRVAWDEERPFLGRKVVMRLAVSDPESGIRSIRVALVQKGKTSVVLDEQFPSAGWTEGGIEKHKTMEIVLEPLAQGVINGEAILETEVRDYSLKNWSHGNKTLLSQEVVVDTVPPIISVAGNTRYLNQGGSGVVIYRISKEVAQHGVRVGDTLFPGYPVPEQPGLYEAFFAVRYDTADVAMQVFARDRAGNQATFRFPYKIASKRPRNDRIVLSDETLNALAEKYLAENPDLNVQGSPLEVFVAMNTNERGHSQDAFAAVCSRSNPEPLWEGAFVTLANAVARAGFADQRVYEYKGKAVSESVHLGLDLASLATAPVPAGNNGVVVEAQYMGIYGNTIVLDHGMGLFSTYSHLSAFKVSKGDYVRKGGIIGHTGATGLALGDHLHFGIAVQGVFVNPVEWIDSNWVEKKILDPLNMVVGTDSEGPA